MEERHRLRYWGVEEGQRMECPYLPRHITLAAPRVVHQTGSFLNFTVHDFSIELNVQPHPPLPGGWWVGLTL